jgi:hypothetical protein
MRTVSRLTKRALAYIMAMDRAEVVIRHTKEF